MKILVPILLAGALLGCDSTSRKAPVKDNALSPVLQLTAASFPGVTSQAAKPVLIDFWASWCGPCRTQGPIVEQVAETMGDRAVVAKVNVDEERGLAAQFGVQSIPTLVILKDGKEVQRFVGVQNAEILINALKK